MDANGGAASLIRRFFHPGLLLCPYLVVGSVAPAHAPRCLPAEEWLAEATLVALQVFLDDFGGEFDTRDRFGRTLLHLAVLSNYPAVVTLLLDRGADATLRDHTGKRPIDYAEENAVFQDTDGYRRLRAATF